MHVIIIMEIRVNFKNGKKSKKGKGKLVQMSEWNLKRMDLRQKEKNKLLISAIIKPFE